MGVKLSPPFLFLVTLGFHKSMKFRWNWHCTTAEKGIKLPVSGCGGGIVGGENAEGFPEDAFYHRIVHYYCELSWGCRGACCCALLGRLNVVRYILKSNFDWIWYDPATGCAITSVNRNRERLREMLLARCPLPFSHLLVINELCLVFGLRMRDTSEESTTTSLDLLYCAKWSRNLC